MTPCLLAAWWLWKEDARRVLAGLKVRKESEAQATSAPKNASLAAG